MTHIIFIAGAGQDKTAWHTVADKLPDAFTTHAFAATDHAAPFSIQDSAEALYKYMTEQNIECAVLCGLSLGSMISTEFAIRYPEQVEALILCGSQVHPNKFLMALQSSIMRLLPEKALGLPPELTKAQLLDILRESSKVDFRVSLDRITARTLVICGEKDKPNLPASRYLANHIANASLRTIPSAGHQINVNNPDELRSLIVEFLQ